MIEDLANLKMLIDNDEIAADYTMDNYRGILSGMLDSLISKYDSDTITSNTNQNEKG